MSTLYELTENYLALTEMDPEDDADFAEALENSLDEITDDFNEKSINIVKYEKNLLAERDAIKNEIKNMQTRAKSLNNKVDQLRDYLKTNMIETGINKISCPFFVISLRNTKASVIIDDDKKVPQEYIDTTLIEKVSKTRLYGDLKDGIDIAGCHLQENKSLIIK